ncbi:pathogenesis-related protein 1A-like [Typha angustifolia]|uniref:pathogenesis-related protein 1A-like n=1 Tax=Typha angustifolia TaxID=59011 RepID=UPI003C2CABF3
MALPSSSFLASVVIFLALFSTTTLAQNSPQDFLDPHNSARADVGVAPMSWNDTVAAYAQDYASQRAADCQLEHSGGPYGENIFWGGGSSWTAADAVNSWVSEKQYYDYESNSCSAPPNESCGHYTQVVWADSLQLGCAAVTCDSGDTFITCNYYPPGNYEGERPY